MNRRHLLFLAIGLGIFLASLAYYLASPTPPASSGAPSSAPATPASASAPGPSLPGAGSTAAARAMSAAPTPGGGLLGEIERLLEKLQRRSFAAEDLAALREKLLHGDPREAIAAISEFLRSGRDASTGEELALAEGGLLTGSPTLRVLLMDLLGQIARNTHSDAAANVARAVLETKTSPEEWALSLRNVAWQDPAATPYLAAKMREMLAEPAWTAAPSAGLLEAFDVIVYSGDPSFIPQLAEMTRGGLSELQRAALVTLDRLSEQSPTAVMDYLNSHPGELADRPLFRADYFAKADLSQPVQQAALETYLSRADVAPEEKTKLLKELATPASFVSDSLLTKPLPPGDDAARRTALATALQGWLAANRFPELAGTMQQVLGRMAQ